MAKNILQRIAEAFAPETVSAQRKLRTIGELQKVPSQQEAEEEQSAFAQNFEKLKAEQEQKYSQSPTQQFLRQEGVPANITEEEISGKTGLPPQQVTQERTPAPAPAAQESPLIKEREQKLQEIQRLNPDIPVSVLEGMTLEQLAPFYKSRSRDFKNVPLSLRPAIESGYASREFVKEIIPELGDVDDISIGEFQQKLGLKKTEMGLGAPKPLSGEQIDKITQVRTAIDGLGNIKDKLFNLISKGKSPISPIGGRFEQLKSKIGIQTDQEISEFQTDTIAQLNTYLNSISGAAITEQEAERLRLRLPGLGMTMEQFLGRMDSFESELNRSISARIKTLKEAGFKIGDLDKFIAKETPKAKPQTHGSEDADFNASVQNARKKISSDPSAKAAVRQKLIDAFPKKSKIVEGLTWLY